MSHSDGHNNMDRRPVSIKITPRESKNRWIFNIITSLEAKVLLQYMRKKIRRLHKTP